MQDFFGQCQWRMSCNLAIFLTSGLNFLQDLFDELTRRSAVFSAICLYHRQPLHDSWLPSGQRLKKATGSAVGNDHGDALNAVGFTA
jgi:hypothetical protein